LVILCSSFQLITVENADIVDIIIDAKLMYSTFFVV